MEECLGGHVFLPDDLFRTNPKQPSMDSITTPVSPNYIETITKGTIMKVNDIVY